MRKLIALFLLAAVGASAQVTNTVNISNSLLGPITNVFTNTQISVGEAIITGAVFNASVTNTFSPSITNEISVGAVSVTNNVTNEISVTNIIENIAVAVTNTVNITNITQTFVTTSGVSSISRTGAVQGAITFEGSGVTQTGTVFNFSGGGGGGDVTINGVTTNEFTFVYQYPIVGSNIGNTIYWGLVSLDGLVIQPAFTNYQTINFTGPTSTTYVVGVGVTQLVVHLWGGGGLGSISPKAGGYTEVFINVTTGEVLTVEVGEASLDVPATNATGASVISSWPDGGFGFRRFNTSGATGSGAGSTRLWRGTNLIAVAGGAGGGTLNSTTSGGGGGISGGSGTASTGGTGGGGGTQTDGGLTGSTAIPLLWTNTAGSYLQGGSAGGTTNNTAGNFSGGGGGGYYGGGGALVISSTTGIGIPATGGGGSGYYNPDLVIFGTTIRTDGTFPAGIDQPWYSTDIGGFGWGTGRTATRGAHGAVVIRTEF
jgi:hypothetical protein